MSKFKVAGVIPSKVGESTGTPNRKFMQFFLQPQTEGKTLNSLGLGSKNVFEGYQGDNAITGEMLNIKADPLFISAMEVVGNLPTNYPWGVKLQGNTPEEKTPEEFKALIGYEVEAEIPQEYVEPYTIEDSFSKDKRRVQWSGVVLAGENKFQVFRNNGHPIIQDPKRLEEIKKLAAEIANTNEVAREKRKLEREAAGAEYSSGRGTKAIVDVQQAKATPLVKEPVK